MFNFKSIKSQSVRDITRLVVAYNKSMSYDEFLNISVIGCGDKSIVILVRDLIKGKLYAMKILEKKNLLSSLDIISIKREREV